MIKQGVTLLAPFLLSLPRWAKIAIVMVVDALLCALTVWGAYYLRFGYVSEFSIGQLLAIVLATSLSIPCFIYFGLYRAIFRYIGLPVLLVIIKAIAVYSLLYGTVITLVGISNVPKTVGIIQPILLLMVVTVSRAFARLWLGGSYQQLLKRFIRRNVLIYGAGGSGQQLAAAMVSSHELKVVGFLDDDVTLQKRTINGYRVYDPKHLKEVVENLDVGKIFMALPSRNRKRRKEIIEKIREAHIEVRTLPSINDITEGKVKFSDLKELDIDDLLGREAVIPSYELLKNCISDKVVLVTGAGGSIGGELCRQILSFSPRKILLVEQNEFALYKIHERLISESSKIELIPLIASVQDETRVAQIISSWQPDFIYHAAAYKHVPLVEQNLIEGIQNNVLGTLVVAQQAALHKVPNFVLISTDKAVRPTNIMGATKRLAEMILQSLEIEAAETKFSMVRFGNVLGSSGSVVPKFWQQIHDGGPISLTHHEITRYFMTIPEAAQLVLQASAMADGGDVFVLDMGEPVKIIELAKQMIELSGLSLRDCNNPNGDIEIEIIGLRPGEKLYEELLIGNNPQFTSHPRIMRANEPFMNWELLNEVLDSLRDALSDGDAVSAKMILEKIIPEYQSNSQIVDWVYVEKNHSIGN
jgi:FlaA1/EpsC-like NDP-sugar epimerase